MAKPVRSENARALDKMLKKGGPVAAALVAAIPRTTLREHRDGVKVPGPDHLYVYERYDFTLGGWLTAKRRKAAEKLVNVEAIIEQRSLDADEWARRERKASEVAA
jgi:hypothetical protein